MTRRSGLLLAALLPGAALAQPIVATPLPPPPQATPQQAPPAAHEGTAPGQFPGQSPGQPLGAPNQPSAPEPGTPAPGTPEDQNPQPETPQVRTPPEQNPAGQNPEAETPAPTWPNVWVPRGSAVLQLLDKVNALATTATVKVGQSVRFGSLNIEVRACDVRPPDQPADATAFLVITDSHSGEPGFKGWMLRSDPSLSMLEHPLYDVRVVGCGG